MPHLRRSVISCLGASAASIGLGCGDRPATAPGATPPDVQAAVRATAPPLPSPASFVAVVTNQYYPLIPGTKFHYRSETEDGTETTVVEVTHQTRTILGIAATVVRDQVLLNGELIEDTFDWYAQDVSGNVWYLGEESCEIQAGQCVSTEGSWEAGVAGATAGIIMWADPGARQGEAYRQEFLEGEAEDVAKVVRLNASVETPYGSFVGCLETMDWTPLEPGVREHKFYCPGTGLVLEVAPRKVRARNELVAIEWP